jgi:hypothetical protein
VSASTSAHGRSPGGVARIIIGTLLGLVAAGFLAAGGTALWADQTQRDADGYFTSSAHPYATGTRAITHEAHVDGVPHRVEGKLVKIRITATSTGGRPIFVGVARRSAVDAYLAGVSRADVHDVDFDPFKAEYDRVAGSRTPAPPASQRIWAASATGAGTQTLNWSVHNGRWTVVAMNADGSPQVATNVSFGANVSHMGWIWASLFAAGGVLLTVAAVLIVTGSRRNGRGDRSSAADDDVAAPATPTVYPAAVSAKLDEPLSRWLWLVKWLLAIPHVIVLGVLWVGSMVLLPVTWIAVLATGRYPRWIFDYQLGVLRWSWRVTYYGYGSLGTDRYPPFSLGPEPDYPATLHIAYPERVDRGTALVRWVLAIPHFLIVGIIAGGGAFWLGDWSAWPTTVPWSGLIALLTAIAGVILLVQGRYPRGLFDFIVGLNRWVVRVAAYAMLMTDEYPPFRLDSGGNEPAAAPPSAAPSPA